MSAELNAYEDPNFIGFLRKIYRILNDETSESLIVENVASAMAKLLVEPLRLPEAYRKPRQDRYVMYPLYIAKNGSFSVAAAVWNVGQKTPVHDHGVWGVVGIVEGVEGEIRYLKPSRRGRALEKLPNVDFGPGEVTVCCTSDADIHAVECASETPCVGIHVYGGNIGKIRRRTYRPDNGEVGYFTSVWPDMSPAVLEV